MKTLDEVIEDYKNVHAVGDTFLWIQDALYYLKEYQNCGAGGQSPCG